MTSISKPVFVNADYGMQYQGKILQLLSFKGPVTLYSNTFENNNLAIMDCDVYANLQNTNN